MEPYVNFAIRLDVTWCLTCPLLSPQPRVSRIMSRRIRWAAQLDWIESKYIKRLFNFGSQAHSSELGVNGSIR